MKIYRVIIFTNQKSSITEVDCKSMNDEYVFFFRENHHRNMANDKSSSLQKIESINSCYCKTIDECNLWLDKKYEERLQGMYSHIARIKEAQLALSES